MKARDERPAANVDYKNYFDGADRARSTTAPTDDQWKSSSTGASAVSKLKWGQK
jgi:hypothetical protein